MQRFLIFILLTLPWFSFPQPLYGQISSPAVGLPAIESPPNLRQPTLGGVQLWTDYYHFHQWRIQQNALTGHYRLLDADDYRHAWGTYGDCRRRLEEIKKEQNLPPMSGTAVLVLHGLGETRWGMRNIVRYIEQYSDYRVLNVSYASTRYNIADHAAALHEVIQNLDNIERIHFVGHSMGNMVIRHYLADRTDPQTGRQGDPRIGRFVMLGPPNNGAELAKRYGDNAAFEWIAGEAGMQLGKDWRRLERHLAVPQCPFGIIAGGFGEEVNNPLIPGDDDFIVTIDDAKLPGAADFAVLPVMHAFMMDDPKVQEYTLGFLRNGYFVSEAERHPLPAAEAEGAKP